MDDVDTHFGTDEDYDVTMLPEQKAKWIEALRSGKYEQGKDYLCADGKFCCLGVLAEINNVPRNEDEDIGPYKVQAYEFEQWGNYQSILPPGYAGMNSGFMAELATRNDRGQSFSGIADYIEKVVK